MCVLWIIFIENIGRPMRWDGKHFVPRYCIKGMRGSAIIYRPVEIVKLNNLNIYADLENVYT